MQAISATYRDVYLTTYRDQHSHMSKIQAAMILVHFDDLSRNGQGCGYRRVKHGHVGGSHTLPQEHHKSYDISAEQGGTTRAALLCLARNTTTMTTVTRARTAMLEEKQWTRRRIDARFTRPRIPKRPTVTRRERHTRGWVVH